MNAQNIWDSFQDPKLTLDVFLNSRPRYEFISKYISANQRVLNVGVGRGGLESLLLQKGAFVSSLDPSEQAVNYLRDNLSLGNQARVGFSQNMPFDDDQFDIVVMSELLEHLDDEVLKMSLHEATRVLRKGGLLFVTVPANETLQDHTVVCPCCRKIFHRWGHVRSFDKNKIKSLLREHGFLLKKLSVMAFPDWLRPGLKNFAKNCIRYFLGKLSSPLSDPRFFFIAENLN